MKAAGRTLTVGELRAALAGLRDDDPIDVVTRDLDDALVSAVHPASGGGVHLLVEASLRRQGTCDECGDGL